jgi:hypothetical protein
MNTVETVRALTKLARELSEKFVFTAAHAGEIAATLNAGDALLAQLQQESAAVPPDETAWLLEYDGTMLSAIGALDTREATQYLSVRNKGYGAGELCLTADANAALRFSRKSDAEAMLGVYAGARQDSVAWIGKYLSAKEHMWPTVTIKEQPNES